MPSATLSELDTLFHQLQRRMVESGEWERILLQLRYQLRDAGWLDSAHAQMLEHAHGVGQPSFHELLNETRSFTNGIPLFGPKLYSILNSRIDLQSFFF
ncbi:hypothetical protein BC827DRAFT_202497 [Russula dissimulans]|nr:hypothetical protein BC827DRAFT_202497 [Russula dissimulans]